MSDEFKQKSIFTESILSNGSLHESDENEERSPYRLNSACGKYIYHLGIIDYLQHYDKWKKAERVIKRVKVKFGKEHFGADDISCIEPNRYRDRFLQFMQRVVFKNIK